MAEGQVREADGRIRGKTLIGMGEPEAKRGLGVRDTKVMRAEVLKSLGGKWEGQARACGEELGGGRVWESRL